MAGNTMALQNEANSLMSQAQWDKALELYEKILAQDPENGDACVNASKIYAIRGRIPETVEKYLLLMKINRKFGEYKSALENAKWVLRLQPENIDVRMLSIQIYKQQKDIKALVAEQIRLARIFVDSGKGEEAIKLLKDAQEYAPSDLNITLQLADISMSHGQMSEAVNYYKIAANSFLQRKEFAEALDAFRRIKVMASNDAKLLMTLGNLYYILGRYAEAQTEYRNIFSQDMNNKSAFMAFGFASQKRKLPKDALLGFNKVVQIDPTDPLALEKIGEINEEMNNNNEAIKNYVNSATNYQQVGERESAIKLYQRVLKLDPTNPTANRELTSMGAPFESDNCNEPAEFNPQIDEITDYSFVLPNNKEESDVDSTSSSDSHEHGYSRDRSSSSRDSSDKEDRSHMLVRKDSSSGGKLMAKGFGKKGGMGRPMLGGGSDEEEDGGMFKSKFGKKGGLKGKAAKPVLKSKAQREEEARLQREAELAEQREREAQEKAKAKKVSEADSEFMLQPPDSSAQLQESKDITTDIDPNLQPPSFGGDFGAGELQPPSFDAIPSGDTPLFGGDFGGGELQPPSFDDIPSGDTPLFGGDFGGGELQPPNFGEAMGDTNSPFGD
ncbi:tetratricopeptide repeat protein, partial [bacterium]|nr:tetratricopeptide repeat protein [bacterium]